MTTMIATCSVEKRNIDVSYVVMSYPMELLLVHLALHSYQLSCLQETISTCRFSQRVALVKNDATLNEELDPKLVCIIAGKQQIQIYTM